MWSVLKRIRRIAILAFASSLIFEVGARGLIEGLASPGYPAGDRMELTRYNAEADLATVNTRFLLINTSALANLREPWRAPPDVLAKAAVVIDEQGRHERAKISGAAGRNR